ncbi:hypothetical protein IWX49DRAFT_154175 [Phyllosticta citricarpa]
MQSRRWWYKSLGGPIVVVAVVWYYCGACFGVCLWGVLGAERRSIAVNRRHQGRRWVVAEMRAQRPSRMRMDKCIEQGRSSKTGCSFGRSGGWAWVVATGRPWLRRLLLRTGTPALARLLPVEHPPQLTTTRRDHSRQTASLNNNSIRLSQAVPNPRWPKPLVRDIQAPSVRCRLPWPLPPSRRRRHRDV